MLKVVLVYLSVLSSTCLASLDWSADQNPDKWYRDAQDRLNRILHRDTNNNLAKNVIMFLGDGNSF